MNGRFRHCLLLILALAGLSCGAHADTLYRWTDSDGQPHYGDRPPPAGAAEVEQLQLPSYSPPDPPVQDDPYSILNQVERLEAYRQNLNRERQAREQQEQAQREYELRKRELEARQQSQQDMVDAPVYGYPIPVYPGRPVHRPNWPFDYPRPPGLWKPDHPAYRPPGYQRPPGGAPHSAPYPAPRGAGILVPAR